MVLASPHTGKLPGPWGHWHASPSLHTPWDLHNLHSPGLHFSPPRASATHLPTAQDFFSVPMISHCSPAALVLVGSVGRAWLPGPALQAPGRPRPLLSPDTGVTVGFFYSSTAAQHVCDLSLHFVHSLSMMPLQTTIQRAVLWERDSKLNHDKNIHRVVDCASV